MILNAGPEEMGAEQATCIWKLRDYCRQVKELQAVEVKNGKPIGDLGDADMSSILDSKISAEFAVYNQEVTGGAP